MYSIDVVDGDDSSAIVYYTNRHDALKVYEDLRKKFPELDFCVVESDALVDAPFQQVLKYTERAFGKKQ